MELSAAEWGQMALAIPAAAVIIGIIWCLSKIGR